MNKIFFKCTTETGIKKVILAGIFSAFLCSYSLSAADSERASCEENSTDMDMKQVFVCDDSIEIAEENSETSSCADIAEEPAQKQSVEKSGKQEDMNVRTAQWFVADKTGIMGSAQACGGTIKKMFYHCDYFCRETVILYPAGPVLKVTGIVLNSGIQATGAVASCGIGLTSSLLCGIFNLPGSFF